LARKILLADDSVTAQNMGRKILADAGYEVVTVNNGSAALKKIAELKPDLVILDVYMPGYSGLEVCQRLKESQDSSRIPVLLTVGKLEPFKPEEARRVRAEGFIVKPFEASELLSALSKLEDKVVPRAEPSKPGRFARAIAAQEESGRSGGNESASQENGWKSRIGFPHKKTEAEEKVADEASIYNPVNRDLRTVVETAAEKITEERQASETREANLDVAALAPVGLPSDVTPEELAAIAAAAAQIHAIKDEQKVTELTAHTSLEPFPDAVEAAQRADVPPQLDVAGDSATLANADTKPESAPAEAPVIEHRRNRRHDDPKPEPEPEEEQDLPVTMASAPDAAISVNQGGSRWSAVAVALEGDEATLSLDQEMQKAYTAFVAEETASRENPPPAVEANIQQAAESVPVIDVPNLQPVLEPDHAISLAAAESEPEPPIPSEIASVVSSLPIDPSPPTATGTAPVEGTVDAEPVQFAQPSPEVPTPESVELQLVEQSLVEKSLAESTPAEPTSAEPALAQTLPAPELVEVASPAVQTETSSDDSQDLPPVEAAIVEAPPSSAFAPIVPVEEPKTEETPEDSETVKSTAAAWASWRQIRDTGDAKPAEPSRQEFEMPAHEPEPAAAMAAAAGAEQILHDTPAPSSENPSDVASIVDSVLADLRPKLMAEISRKMAEKK
jgi:CheY-like chemotaxis protein